MGQSQSIAINFEDMQQAIKNSNMNLIINTLPSTEQHCLIRNTICESEEESIINQYLSSNKYIPILVYGKNAEDKSVALKCQQLQTLGFTQIYYYSAGLFEWLLLQDIYGKELFPTNGVEPDLLKYKVVRRLNAGLLQN
jgi:hypothetical protein